MVRTSAFWIGAKRAIDYQRKPNGNTRAGANAPNVTRYFFGDDAKSLGEYAWFKGNPDGRSHPVGEKRPNGLGLFDMHGNMCELLWDGWSEGDYEKSRENDPQP